MTDHQPFFSENIRHFSEIRRSSSSSGYDLVADSSFGPQRKKRMARQRRSKVYSQPFFSRSFSPLIQPQPPSRNIATQDIDQKSLTFLFQKELKHSDVSSLRRIILPKVSGELCRDYFPCRQAKLYLIMNKESPLCRLDIENVFFNDIFEVEKPAEAYLPILETKEGSVIDMDDIDGVHVWRFKYRFWPNNNSRMYVLENTGDFVNAHGLELGDFIILYQDVHSQTYLIEGKKAGGDEEMDQPFFFQDNKQSQCRYLEVDIPSDDMTKSFVYDTSFIDDPMLGLFDASMITYSSATRVESFGSVDIFSLDDDLKHS